MIILLGTREKIIKSGQINNVQCPRCNNSATFNYFVFSSYTHLTLIPLFPTSKRVDVQCKSCSNSIDFNELSEEDLSKLIKDNENLKHPIWTFSGSFIAVIALFYFGYNYYQSSNNDAVFVKNPLVNDVFYTKDSKGYYSTMKVNTISKDSVNLTLNDYLAYLPYEIDEIDTPENYTNKKINYSKSDIIKMFEEDEIISIIRN